MADRMYQYRIIQVMEVMSSDHPSMETLLEKVNLAARSRWTLHTWTSVPHGNSVLHTVVMQKSLGATRKEDEDE